MKKYAMHLIALALLLTACSGGSNGGDSPPGTTIPADCSEVLTRDVTIPTTWRNGPGDCDYYIPSAGDGNHTLSISSVLTIDTGTVIKVGQDVRLDIEKGGAIIAHGTAEEPIVLEALVQTHGYWYGLCFDGNGESSLNYVRLFSAGKVWSGGSGVCDGAISGVTDNGEPVHINNSHIAGSYTSGVSAYGFHLGQFENNKLYANRLYGARVPAKYLHRLSPTNDFSGAAMGQPNGRQYVLTGGTLEHTDHVHRWRQLDVPYFVGGEYPYDSNVIVQNYTGVDIESGTEFFFGDGASFNVWDRGVLRANGSVDERIVFRGEVEQPGYWDGLYFSEAAEIQLDHVDVLWGGGGSLNPANVYIYNGAVSPDSVLANLHIDGSASCGIRVSEALGDVAEHDTIT